MVCCSSPVGHNFFIFTKKRFDHLIELICARTWFPHRFVTQHESRSGYTVLFESRIANSSQEETFGYLLSGLEEDKFSESDFFYFFFVGHPGLLCD